MAIALRFNPDGTSGGDVVTFTSSINNNAGTTAWAAEFRIKLIAGYPATGNWYILGSNGTGITGLGLRQASGDGALALVIGGTFRVASAAGYILNDGNFHTYRVEHDAGGAMRFYRDGTQFGSGTTFTASALFACNRFGAGNTTATVFTPFEMEYFTFTGSANGRTWRADLSGGTGVVLPTDEGSNQGTLNNFTAVDADKWINYGGAPDTAVGSGIAQVNAVAFGSGVATEGDVTPGSGYAQVKAQSTGVGFALDTDAVQRSGFAVVTVQAGGTALIQDLDSLLASGRASVVVQAGGTGFWQETGGSSDTAIGSGRAVVNVLVVGTGFAADRDQAVGSGNNVVYVQTFGAGTWQEISNPTSDLATGSGYAQVNAVAFGSGISIDNGSGWDVPTILFTEAAPIVAIALTFDQLGRPIVFYQTANNDLKLYWFDPVAGQNVTQLITTGQYPTAAFDYLTNINYQESDAWIFYTKGNTVYSRLQRDRWAIEHLVRTYESEPIIRSAGFTNGGRLQVVVDTVGACPVNNFGIDPVDTNLLTIGFAAGSLIGTFVPEPPKPVDPPVIEDPDPPVIVDPPEVVRPTTPQGYWIKYPETSGWLMGSSLIDHRGGFRLSVKVKKRVNTDGIFATIFSQGEFLQLSPTNQYYTGTLRLYMLDGKFWVLFGGAATQATPKFWFGSDCPLFKIEFEMSKTMQGVIRFWEETPDGSGYGAVQEYQFPNEFTDLTNPSFTTHPREKFCLGATPQYFGTATNPCDTILRDFSVVWQNQFGAWDDRLDVALDDWNNPVQYPFTNYRHKSTLWLTITGA